MSKVMANMDEISPRLERIESYSNWLKDDAASITHSVRTLKSIPGFETRAAYALKQARERITDALAEVDKAITDYAAKSVEGESAV